MPTIIRCGGGIPVSDYESLQSSYNNLNSQYNSYKSSHSHTNDEYNSYGSSQYNAGVNSVLNNVGNVTGTSAFRNYASGTSYSSVLDTKNNHTKGVMVTGTHSGSASNGGAQGSNNNSSWTNIGSGKYTYRYYRAYAKCNDDSSSISYGYVGVIDLGR